MSAEVDVVIAVHTPARPIERAVGSVLDEARSRIRVTVVVHNTDVEPIAQRLAAWHADDRVRIVPFRDGISSPAGPMNHGFDLAEAPYVSLLGSDDTFEPGAVDEWLRVARRDGADMVIAPIRTTSGHVVPTPPVRLTRRRGLRAAADRLVYRSAPLGLMSLRLIDGIRFPVEIATGEDQPFLAQIWSTSARFSFPAAGPGYLVHEDQGDRVTEVTRPVVEEFAYMDAMLDPGAAWMQQSALRCALLAKILRVHIPDAYANRATRWSPRDAEELATVIERIVTADPRALRVLGRAETRLLAALRAQAPTEDIAASEARRRVRSFAGMLTPQLRYTLHRQAPFRLRLAGAAIARGRRAQTEGAA